MEELGEIKALFKVWLKVLLSLLYSYYIVSKLPKGKLRLFSLFPIFYLFIILPLSLSSPTTAGLTGFFISWLAIFKLLLFSFNQGPLSQDHLPRNSLFTFILVASLPIKIKKKYPFATKNYKLDGEQILPLSLWSRSLIYILLVIAAFFSDYNKNMHPKVLLGIYGCVVYLNLEIIMGLCNKLVGSILGVELSPPFNEPYLSTSLQDFWGKRWNLMVSDVLRHTIYLPVRAFWEFHFGKKLASLIAVMVAFVVSGLMHELIFYYITRASPTWEVTCFFLLNGVCLVVEIGLKRASGLGHKWQLHWALSGPLAIGFVMVTAFRLFFPQLVRNQIDVKSLEEVRAVGRLIKGILGRNPSTISVEVM